MVSPFFYTMLKFGVRYIVIRNPFFHKIVEIVELGAKIVEIWLKNMQHPFLSWTWSNSIFVSVVQD